MSKTTLSLKLPDECGHTPEQISYRFFCCWERMHQGGEPNAFSSTPYLNLQTHKTHRPQDTALASTDMPFLLHRENRD